MMEKIIKNSLLLVIVLFMLVGCGSREETKNISFDAQYIRTDGNVEEITTPVVKKILSFEELETYYKENINSYDFTNNSLESVSFTTAIDKYDESYFEDSFLVLILMEEDSSNVLHEVNEIGEDGDILITRKLSEVDGNDAVKWHIIVELSKEYSDIDYSVSFEKIEK